MPIRFPTCIMHRFMPKCDYDTITIGTTTLLSVNQPWNPVRIEIRNRKHYHKQRRTVAMVIVTKIRKFFFTFTITTLMIWCKLLQRNPKRSRSYRKERGSDQSQDISFQSHIFEKWEWFSKVAKMAIYQNRRCISGHYCIPLVSKIISLLHCHTTQSWLITKVKVSLH